VYRGLNEPLCLNIFIAGYLNLGTTDILGTTIFVMGKLLCTVGYLSVTLASSTVHSSVVMTKNVCKLC
jgi:hypothetical protein